MGLWRDHYTKYDSWVAVYNHLNGATEKAPEDDPKSRSRLSQYLRLFVIVVGASFFSLQTPLAQASRLSAKTRHVGKSLGLVSVFPSTITANMVFLARLPRAVL